MPVLLLANAGIHFSRLTPVIRVTWLSGVLFETGFLKTPSGGSAR